MEKNLQSGEAITKLQEMVSDIRTCIFITSGKSCMHSSRPMAAVEADHQGNIWFFTSNHSNKVKDIEQEAQVDLVFAHPGKDSYLHIKGRAVVVSDKTTIAEKWTPIVKAWFPGGINDPGLCLVKVKSDEAHYWDTESTKMVEMLKVALSAITGKSMAEGVHGELHI
jgi:general stress protein 26